MSIGVYLESCWSWRRIATVLFPNTAENDRPLPKAPFIYHFVMRSRQQSGPYEFERDYVPIGGMAGKYASLCGEMVSLCIK